MYINKKPTIIIFVTAIASVSQAHAVTISQKPLFTQSKVEPNIMFTLDDSESMNRTYLPDDSPPGESPVIDMTDDASTCAQRTDIRADMKLKYGLTSSAYAYLCDASNYNRLSYNPSVTYLPQVNYDGTSKADGTQTCNNPTITTITAQTKTDITYSNCKVTQPYKANTNTITQVCDTSAGADTQISNQVCGNVQVLKDGTYVTQYVCTPTVATYTYNPPTSPSALLTWANSNGLGNGHASKYFYCTNKSNTKTTNTYYSSSSNNCTSNCSGVASNAQTGIYQCDKLETITTRQNNNDTITYKLNGGTAQTTQALATTNKGGSPYSVNFTTTTPTQPSNVVGTFSAATTTTAMNQSNICKYFRYLPTSGAAIGDKTIANYYSNTNNYAGLVILDSNIPSYDSRQYDPKTGQLISYRTDCTDKSACTYAQELKNYRNWYKYYRTRLDAAKTFIGLAFAELSETSRVGLARINKTVATIDGKANIGAIELPIRVFSKTGGTSSARYKFYTTLYGLSAASGAQTPLRSAMDYVGQYFQQGQVTGSPWADTPNTAGTAFSQCRQSFNIMMTDGNWTKDTVTPTAFSVSPNVDNSNGPNITIPGSATPYYYLPMAPYKDTYANTLADVAMYYWNHDLATDIDNKVSVTPSDPVAVWQHLVQFTVGFGVSGTLNQTDIDSGNPVWTNPIANNDEDVSTNKKTDDLWHAAINSHGSFYNASNPTEFVNALSAALGKINDSAQGSFSMIASNSYINKNGTWIFQAGFESGWSGRLDAYDLTSAGGVNDKKWSASFPAETDRKLFTMVNNSAKSFDWNNLDANMKAQFDFDWLALTPTQQSQLISSPTSMTGGSSGLLRFNYIRGDKSQEIQRGGALRDRTTLLGDIVNSAPLFVGNTDDYGYGDAASASTPGHAQYASFLVNKKTKSSALYVGANDGMLHGFDPSTGKENFAYIPSIVLPYLSALSSPDYHGDKHLYYVDGSPIAGDAYLNGQWKTILLGSTGAGGSSVFALDITDPASFDESKIMWEFDGTDSADMGYSLPRPAITQLNDGKWVAIVANGYNSTNGHAVLFILDLNNGSILSKIDTGSGTTADKNGLSSPAPIDANGDGITDYVYAGDLKGNLWKFDLNTGASSATVSKLFTACDGVGSICSDNNRQPITTKPQVISHPNGGRLVLFGTGSYFSVEDNQLGSPPRIEALYGVLDDNQTTNIIRDNLVGQTITAEVAAGANVTVGGTKNVVDVRIISHNLVDYSVKYGWYLPLVYPSSANGNGERVVNDLIVSDGKLVVTSIIPSSAIRCGSGGDSWVMDIDPFTGGQLTYSTFKINSDNVIDENDKIGSDYGSGVKSTGMQTQSTIIDNSKCTGDQCTKCTGNCETKTSTGNDGSIRTIEEASSSKAWGRQSWRQIR
ncbi:PilC/PilY family type IV pilus protein [uncultured Tolumonas sp.]|uniref:pilus assembly protein n=1 Tax=uncultured Tolumonas sp. TaxID=263765 RepID=UPI00292E78F8|nr:PilC/PilY family type IV pilus protein [uncultured Tolumonas sp.]